MPIRNLVKKSLLSLAVWTLTALRQIARFIVLSAKPVAIFVRGFGKFLIWFLTPLYRLYFRLKIIFKKLSWPEYWQRLRRDLWFIILFIASSLLLIYQLTAPPVKAEQYGHDNLLFFITKTGENFDEQDAAPITEGPLAYIPQTNPVTEGILQEELPALEKPTLPNQDNYLDQSVLGEPSQDLTLIKPRTKKENYQVQPGDTLSGIARKFNLTLNTLLWENNLTQLSRIKPGQILTILPASGISYKIVKGDTLKKIADRYKVTGDAIAEANNLGINPKLTVGQALFIPGGTKPTITQPKTPTTATIKNALTTRPGSYEPAADSGTRLLWPTNAKRITQYFGWRHTGLDIGLPLGSPIYAAEDGVVQTSGWNSGGYGYYIIINHGGGWQTLYGHNSKLYVAAGETVARGQLIAASGSTGRSTGPHLHFEVRINGSRVNPLGYIR